VFLEFTLAAILTVLLLAGMVRVFFWTGTDLAQRRLAHERILTENCSGATCGLRQLRPVFYRGSEIKAAINSDIF